MALPNEPHTRQEMYLNRIATGSGDIPVEPHTREEMYLDAIAQNGGGGSSGGGAFYVSATYDDDTGNNTLDKNYSEILAAVEEDKYVVIREAFPEFMGVGYYFYPVSSIGHGDAYGVTDSNSREFTSDSATGVLTYHFEPA